ncbi:uncharacterized protein LOC132543484 [Ylistrum balloti]|uniref:uncharacterized protein LOC132543484 n=1 Tax=Ylistrum balloti TaxID=509963 RepID=UPI00290587F9|nr:uncharacterized protein LOC132543484 [Ylistrum balloti]
MGYIWSLISVVLLAGFVTASKTSYQFKNNCKFKLHTLGKSDVALVRFSGSRLPSSNCSIGFRGVRNESSLCVVSKPPFTLNGLGPTLTLSQGSSYINSKSYNYLSIISPSRYCTSGGRYLHIELDGGNIGSSKSRDRGYFTLEVTVTSSSSPSKRLPIAIIAGPVAGGVTLSTVVFIIFRVLRHRRKKITNAGV